ncbi:MAG: MBL fold metallo-hydrolase [Thiomargarita sp.]|nr:MBL fold metallo-hydrolase [Thiomargarita sp.]
MLTVHTLELGPKENFIYLIEDHASKQAAVVDPAWEIDKIIKLVQQQDLEITEVLLTHTHYDHTNGLSEILDNYDAKVHLSAAEADFWSHSLKQPVLHYEGDTIQLGNTKITVWHTPGHTPGSVCYHLDGHLFTGDTLFVYCCGRCDLDGGNPEQMYHSLKKLVKNIPAATIVHPGHYYAVQPNCTMAEQIAGNPFMHFDEIYKFIHYRNVQHNQERQKPYTAVEKTAFLQEHLLKN